MPSSMWTTRGLLRRERQTERRDHRFGLRDQRLGVTPLTGHTDDKVIGVAHESVGRPAAKADRVALVPLVTHRLPRPGVMLIQRGERDVGHQRRENPALDHSAIVARVRERVGDKRILGLIKAFLKAGILTEQGDLEKMIGVEVGEGLRGDTAAIVGTPAPQHRVEAVEYRYRGAKIATPWEDGWIARRDRVCGPERLETLVA